MLRDHGQQKKYYHKLVGCNARMDGLQGAILSVKLKQLDEWNRARRKVAQAYRELLSDIDGLALPKQVTHGTHVYHVFAVRTQRRDRIIEELHANGVHCGIHYPVPIHLQAAYGNLGLDKGSFPVAEQCSEEFVSLPMYPELTDEQISYVAANIRKSLSRSLDCIALRDAMIPEL